MLLQFYFLFSISTFVVYYVCFNDLHKLLGYYSFNFMSVLVNIKANANEIGAFDTICNARHPRNEYLLEIWRLPKKKRQ